MRKNVLKSTVGKDESRLQISSLYSFDPAIQECGWVIVHDELWEWEEEIT